MRTILSLSVALLLTVFTVVEVAAQQYPELPRMHQMSERLYRGAQPGPGGIRRLSELGIKTVINLRGAGAHTRADEAEAKSLGLNYYNIPLPIWGRPNDHDVRRILEIINEPESGRVFIHCRDGLDRTGMIVALHRISQEGWTTDKATAEAMQYGMRKHQYWMRDYISDFHVQHQRTSLNQSDEGSSSGMNDKIGAGVRIGERFVFKTKKSAIRAARKLPLL
jgi:protein tyrosine phosphatase (PTP) superfamily phosphohydrolase (DUF442 family)